MNDYLAVVLLASFLSAVTGFSGAMILLPVLVAVFGVWGAATTRLPARSTPGTWSAGVSGLHIDFGQWL
jgi:uncharacterized membrane protein YfcA